MDIKQAVNKILDGCNLQVDEMREVMMQIMTGKATDAQIGGFLVGLRMKGEAVEEIVGAAQIMRELSTPLHITSKYLVDIVGTGGDSAGIFNVSTASAFVAATAFLLDVAAIFAAAVESFVIFDSTPCAFSNAGLVAVTAGFFAAGLRFVFAFTFALTLAMLDFLLGYESYPLLFLCSPKLKLATQEFIKLVFTAAVFRFSLLHIRS